MENPIGLLGLDLANPYNQYTLIAIGLYALVVFSAFRKHIRVLNSLPGFCAGIGVFFTFVVLYNKLKEFEIQGEDVSFLVPLVRELSAAFSTSIIGVSASLFFNLLVKWRIDFLDNKGYKDKPYIKQHPHELLYEARVSNEQYLTVLKESQEQQFATLVTHQEQQTTAINSLEATFRREFTLLRGEGETANLAQIHQSLSNLTRHTVDRLDNLFQELNQKLGETIAALGTDALKHTQETITTVNNTFTEQTATLLQQNLQQMAEFFNAHKADLEQTAQQFANQNAEMQTGLGHLQTELVEKIQTIQESFADSAALMGKLFNTERAAIQASLADAIGELSRQINEVKGAFSASTHQMAEDYGARAHELNETFVAIKTSLEALNNDVQARVEQVLQGNLDTLEAAFNRLEASQLTAQSNLQQTTKEFAKAVGEYQSLSGNQEAILVQLGEQLSDFAELRDQMHNLQGGWQAFSEQVQLMENRIADIATTIGKLHQIHEYFKVNGQQS